jgi:tetratricopeptide (TPR) repeat protein
MSEAYAEATQPQTRTNKQSLDRWLTVAITLLVVALLALAGYFGYTVWADKRSSELTSGPMRLIQSLESQVRAQPNQVIYRVRLGEAYGAAGKYDKAIEQFKQALKLDPKHVGAYLDLGMVAMLTDNPEQAEKYFQKVVELTEGAEYSRVDDRRENAIYNLGLLKLEQHEYEEAAGYFKEALRIRKDASDSYVNLARALKGMGDNGGAIENLEIALAFDPNFPQAHYMLGEIYRSQKDDVNASYHFYKAAAAAPGEELPAEALAAYGTAAEWMAKATAAEGAGDLDEAVQKVLVARNLDPSNAKAVALHASLLAKKENFKGAIEVCLEALKLDAKDKATTALLNQLVEEHPKAALLAYQSALKKDPTNQELKAKVAELKKAQ